MFWILPGWIKCPNIAFRGNLPRCDSPLSAIRTEEELAIGGEGDRFGRILVGTRLIGGFGEGFVRGENAMKFPSVQVPNFQFTAVETGD